MAIIKGIVFIFMFLMFIWICLKIVSIFLEKRNNTFDTYFGVPGSGKTTFAAYLAKHKMKKKRDVYSNVSIKGCYEISKDDIGYYDISHSLLLFDEAGTVYSSRNYSRNFKDEQVDFFRRHRHYDVDLVFFSQYWNDIDVILRKLSTRLFLLKKSFIPFFICRKQIGKRIGIDELSKQIIDEYYFLHFSTKRIFSPKLWKMFNTHDRKELPKKKFRKYE